MTSSFPAKLFTDQASLVVVSLIAIAGAVVLGTSWRRESWRALALLAALALALRLFIAWAMRGHHDVTVFLQWAVKADQRGLAQVYVGGPPVDYPPGLVYVFRLMGWIMRQMNWSIDDTASVLVLKAPAIACDIGLGLLLAAIVPAGLALSRGAIASLVWFNPAVILNSAAWGQVDSVLTLLLVSCLAAVWKGRLAASGAFLAMAVLAKPQALMVCGAYGLAMLRAAVACPPRGFLRVLTPVAVGGMVFLAGTAFFIHRYSTLNGQSLEVGLRFIWNKYSATLASYPYATVNATNLYYALGWNYVPHQETVGPLSIHALAWTFLSAFLAFCTLIYCRGWRAGVECASLVGLLSVVGFFTLAPKMHERYLYPAIALSLLCYACYRDRRFVMIALLASIVNYLNVAIVLGWMLAGQHRPVEGYVMHLAAYLDVALLGFVMFTAWSVVSLTRSGKPAPIGPQFPLAVNIDTPPLTKRAHSRPRKRR